MKKETTLKLKPKKFALSAAIILSTITFLTTLLAITSQLPKINFITSVLYGQIGYSTSVLGAFIGAAYSFIDTFIIAWIFAWLYNKLL